METMRAVELILPDENFFTYNLADGVDEEKEDENLRALLEKIEQSPVMKIK